jgi:transcriptional regulator with PAS, ATPase and Fis domain
MAELTQPKRKRLATLAKEQNTTPIQLVLKTLEESKDLQAAADALGVTRQAIYNWLDAYGYVIKHIVVKVSDNE